jgi:hypothetical protein
MEPPRLKKFKILNRPIIFGQQQPINPRKALVANRVQVCRHELSRGRISITRTVHHFTYCERRNSIPIGAFILILVELKCPNGHNYYELLFEFVRKGEPLHVLSFFTAGGCFKDPTEGNPMFNDFFEEITQILAVLRFEPDVFLKIARILVPRWYEVTMHLEQEPLIEDECMRQFQRLNPFSIRPDLFGLPARPEKRAQSCLPTIENFSREPAVEVVEEETNKKPIKKRRN